MEDSGHKEKPTKVSILGYSLLLPGSIDSGQQLFDLIANKIQVKRDLVELGLIQESDIAVSDTSKPNPLKYHSRYANFFSREESKSYLLARVSSQKIL